MRAGQRLYWVIGAGLFGLLLMLAGCGRSFIMSGERETWRHEAEEQCLKSGVVKEGAGVVRVEPIEGPGMCGADFPLKVAMIGEGTAYGYGDDVRPPGGIPQSSMPQWPVRQPGYSPPAAAPMRIAPASARAPAGGGIDDYMLNSRPSAMRPAYAPPNAPEYPSRYEPRGVPRTESPRAAAPAYPPPQVSQPEADDIPDDAVLPNRASPPRQSNRASPAAPLPRYEPPKLGPSRPMPVTQVKAAVSPPATLSCPIVSALDKWVSESVQPSAMRWFNQPVVTIKQISSYSCRAMVDGGSGNISEHAFGNALDIAAFVLADGRTVTVKNGWNGRPEESGFLHDVQGAACDVFSTVLAPGYNVYHYDHIHVDLMRRASGRHPCRPTAIPGEVAAAKQLQKSKYAHRGDPAVTGSIGAKSSRLPNAVPGEDGEDDDE